MMRKTQVLASAVYIKGFAKIFTAHGRTFDMPAWSSHAPWAFPGRLSGFGGFPQNKIKRVALPFVNIDSCTGLHIFKPATGKLSIFFEFFNRIIDITIYPVCKTFLYQLFNKLYDLVDMLSGFWFDCCPFNVQGIHIFMEFPYVFFSNRLGIDTELVGLNNDFIIDVGKISDMGHIKSFCFKIACDNIKHHHGPCVPNMTGVIYRRTANIHADLAWF